MNRTWRVVFVLLMGLSLLLAAGCGEQQKKTASDSSAVFAEIKDDAGRTVVLQKKPQRIVVTSASFLEPLHAVGGDVVGRPDSKTKMPEYAKDKTSIGHVYQVDMEKVLACEPDLVIINQGMNEKLAEVLESNGIPTIIVKMKSYEDVKRELQMFAQVTGEVETGKKLIADMDSSIQETIAKLPKEKKRVAILHSTAQGLSVQLEGSIAGNIVQMFGWENVAADMTPMEKNPDAAPYSMETLVEKNPEIIFVTSMGKMESIKQSMQQTIETNPAWQTIPAIQENHLYYLPQDLFLLSPGIHYPEAVEMMAKLMYPEVMK